MLLAAPPELHPEPERERTLNLLRPVRSTAPGLAVLADPDSRVDISLFPRRCSHTLPPDAATSSLPIEKLSRLKVEKLAQDIGEDRAVKFEKARATSQEITLAGGVVEQIAASSLPNSWLNKWPQSMAWFRFKGRAIVEGRLTNLCRRTGLPIVKRVGSSRGRVPRAVKSNISCCVYVYPPAWFRMELNGT